LLEFVIELGKLKFELGNGGVVVLNALLIDLFLKGKFK
jgi:hypothetical protein